MTIELWLTVAGLAVLDCLSPATLAVTVYVLLGRHRHTGRLLAAYLTTIAVAYFLLGVGLALGLQAFFATISRTTELWLQAATGLALIAGGIYVARTTASSRSKPAAKAAQPKRLTMPAIIGFGLVTWAFEAATAVPYIGAIAVMTSSGIPAAHWLVALAIYSVIMIAPFAAIYVMWRLTGERLRAKLEHWQQMLSGPASRRVVAWIIGVAGCLILQDVVWQLLKA